MTSIITIEARRRPLDLAKAPAAPATASSSFPGRRIACGLVGALTALLLAAVCFEAGGIAFGGLVVASAELGTLVERVCDGLQSMLSAPGYWR